MGSREYYTPKYYRKNLIERATKSRWHKTMKSILQTKCPIRASESVGPLSRRFSNGIMYDCLIFNDCTRKTSQNKCFDLDMFAILILVLKGVVFLNFPIAVYRG